jgi:hypothetical protein
MGSAEAHTDDWYVLRDAKPLGPYRFAALVEAVTRGNLVESDMVWRPGWDAWQPASSVPALFVPAPPAPRETEQPPASMAPTQPADHIADASAPDHPPHKTHRSDFARHWHGQLRLPISFWLNSFALGIAAYAALEGVARLLRGETVPRDAIAWAWLGSALLALTLLLVWQSVGTWRSASRYRARGGRPTWAVLTKIALVAIGSLQALITLGLLMPDPSVRVARNGTELVFTGLIKPGSAKEVQRALGTASQVKVMHLKSPGGLLVEADLIAGEVRKRKLATYVSDRCLSGCAIIFLAGHGRWIGESGQLGFHQPNVPGAPSEFVQTLTLVFRVQLHALGLAPWFVDKALSTPHESMWLPSHDQLMAAGAISGVVDSKRHAASGQFDVAPPKTAVAGTRDAVMDAMLRVPAYATLQSVDPDSFGTIVQQVKAGHSPGEPDAAVVARARGAFINVKQQHLLQSNDAAIIELADVLIQYMEGLKTRDEQSCVAVTDPTTGARLRVDLGTEFRETANRELALFNSILKAGHGNAVIPPDGGIEPYLNQVMDQLQKRPDLQSAVLTKRPLAASDYRAYCEARLALLQEIRRLPPAQAAMLLRLVLSRVMRWRRF